MSRDFAKKKTARRKPAATPKQSERQSKSGLIYLAIGLIVGLFVAFLVYLDKIPGQQKSAETKFAHPKNQSGEKSQPKKQSAKKSNKQAQKTAKKNEPKFDFYTMLPDMQVEVNEPVLQKKSQPKNKVSEPVKTAIKKESSNSSSTNTIPYQLQVGAFQSLDKADSMKAQLAFLGVESNISIVWINSNKKIYRVRIGPSKNIKSLEKIRARLKAQNINALMQKAM